MTKKKIATETVTREQRSILEPDDHRSNVRGQVAHRWDEADKSDSDAEPARGSIPRNPSVG